MGTRLGIPRNRGRWLTNILQHSLDSYGTVILLIVLDYIVASTLAQSRWGSVCFVVLVGVTLLFALRTSEARRVWVALAAVYLVVSTLIALVGALLQDANRIGQQLSLVGGLLLIVTPLAIVRRISVHTVVNTETVLGGVCIYLLFGFSFAFIYATIGSLSAVPFFTTQIQATLTEYLFFSYTTLTTVGYGNLVPSGNVGQMFAVLEALSGQIYLVIIVARLVSLWGQARPPREMRQANDATRAARTIGEEPHAHETVEALDSAEHRDAE